MLLIWGLILELGEGQAGGGGVSGKEEGEWGPKVRSCGPKAWRCFCSGDDCRVASPSDPTPAFAHWY